MAQSSPPYVEAVAEEEAKLERMSAALALFFILFCFIFVVCRALILSICLGHRAQSFFLSVLYCDWLADGHPFIVHELIHFEPS